MKLSLSCNIGKLRKEHAMTQEQLAEALGVTFASVSKWERGVATPELKLIAEMADLFGVSLDALVGFEAQDGSAAALENRIHTLQHEKKYAEAAVEAEKALQRYPNDFRIMYRSGLMYALAGIEQSNEAQTKRSITLLEKAVLLLSQNTDPEISETGIMNLIAENYIMLGRYEKGVELLKKYNVGGLFDPLIAYTYAEYECFNPRDAEPYLMRAFGEMLTTAVRIFTGYARYYFRTGDYRMSRKALLWLIQLMENAKEDRSNVAYLDKPIAVFYAICANLSALIGEAEKAESYLRRAYEIAFHYDAKPTYSAENIRFLIGNTGNSFSYDNLGETAIASVENQLEKEKADKQVWEIWEKIKTEETAGGAQ